MLEIDPHGRMHAYMVRCCWQQSTYGGWEEGERVREA